MASDLRLALRGLIAQPAFSLTAILALAIGIGANTAIFSIVHQVLLSPPGVSDPARVVAVRVKYEKLALHSIVVSAPDLADVKGAPQIFARAAIADRASLNFTGGGRPERLTGSRVSADWFEVFGARAVVGRTFRPEEDRPNANREVVLSYAAWQRLFAGAPSTIGRTIDLDDQPYRIVGVMDRDFRWPAGAELWTPMGLPPDAFTEQNRFNENYVAAARLAPGVTLDQAGAWMRVLTDRVKARGDQFGGYARDAAWGEFLVPWTDFVAGNTKTPMFLLMGAVGFVLLIACANMAGLMLARASGRARDIAVRVALGAGRLDLIRRTMAESLGLSIGGAVAGAVLAYVALRALAGLAPADLPVALEPRFDWTLLAFTTAAALASAVVSGIAPAWQASRLDRFDALKEGGRSGMAGVGRQRVRAALVVGEVALALVLLVGAGLLLKSLQVLQGINPGFDPRGVAVGSVTLPRARYAEPDRQAAFYREALDRLSKTPGIAVAAAAQPLPFSGDVSSAAFQIEGSPVPPGEPGPHGDIGVVTPGYFAALKIPLKAGRWFAETDTATTERVAIVDDTLAKQYWPDGDPIGKRIHNGSSDQWATIVGVVGHVKSADLAGDTVKGKYYYDMYQSPRPMASLVARAAGGAVTIAPAIRGAVAAVDPTEPVSQLSALDDMVAASLAPRRLIVTLLGLFAAMALLMSAVGLYGVISYSVAQRTQEIGIRMALGAPRAGILAAVVADGMKLGALGALLGLAVSAGISRAIQHQLFEVSPFDPLTFLAMVGVLAATTLAASLVPARRATRVDPMVALRYQ